MPERECTVCNTNLGHIMDVMFPMICDHYLYVSNLYPNYNMYSLLKYLVTGVQTARQHGMQLEEKVSGLQIENNRLKATNVSNDALAAMKLQIKHEFTAKMKLQDEVIAQKNEIATLKKAVIASNASANSALSKNENLTKEIHQLKLQKNTLKEFNEKVEQDLTVMKAARATDVDSTNKAIKKIEAMKLASDNAAARFNRVNQILKETKRKLQTEQEKAGKLEEEIQELKTKLHVNLEADNQQLKYVAEIKRLNDEMSIMQNELVAKDGNHALEMKELYEKMHSMQSEWKGKEGKLVSELGKVQSESQSEIKKLKNDLVEAKFSSYSCPSWTLCG